VVGAVKYYGVKIAGELVRDDKTALPDLKTMSVKTDRALKIAFEER
jgi:hypothetical protein